MTMQGTLRRQQQQNNHQRDVVDMGSSNLRSSSPFNVAVDAASVAGDTASADYHQMGVNNCLSQSPHFEAANTIPVANNLNNSSSNVHGSSGQDGKFSMNLIKFPHHNHEGLLLGSDDEQHHQQQQYSNQHNGNFKLDSDRTDISTSLAHFNAPLQHSALPAGRQGAGQLHHNHHQQRFEEVDEDGGEMGLDEGDKKFNQLQELENSLLMQNLQSNFLKKLDTTAGYSASNPDYRSLNRRSGFIDTPGSNATTAGSGNYPQYQQQQQMPASSSTNQIPLSSSSGSSNPFQRMMGTPVSAQTIKGGHSNTVSSSSGGSMNGPNNYHAMNTSNSSQSIRNTTRSHIITDTLPGPESCV